MKLIGLLPLGAAAYSTRLGEEGHGIWKHGDPVCCSVSATEDCVRTHPCRAEGPPADPEAVHQSFMAYLAKFEKTYDTVEEWAHRLTVYAENAAKVLAHDAKDAGFDLGLDNQFADWTAQEFEDYQKIFTRPKPRGARVPRRDFFFFKNKRRVGRSRA